MASACGHASARALLQRRIFGGWQNQDSSDSPAESFLRPSRRTTMRFRIEVRTLDGKLSYQRDVPVDALHVAEGGKESLGVTITDTQDDKTYSLEEFRGRFGH
jgi:hypothetical protein